MFADEYEDYAILYDTKVHLDTNNNVIPSSFQHIIEVVKIKMIISEINILTIAYKEEDKLQSL